jgi:hypothetical protein
VAYIHPLLSATLDIHNKQFTNNEGACCVTVVVVG